ncbi:MAG: DNA-directed RNA polymerase subunit alpha [Chloroflexota bacterium]
MQESDPFMIELEAPPTTRIEEVESRGDLSIFEVNPLADGYGVTLGNALRRVLLNSLEGAAVTSVQVAGVFHEFSTIDNVKEDVTQIVLNIKKLRLRSFARHAVTLKLMKHGAGAVTAADIAESADVEIVNPELVLLTLDSDAGSIEMDLTVETGVGYRPAEHAEDLPIGIIPVDAIFTPVRRVNFIVSDTRVGQMTNFDRLTLEIETDGTSTPKAALSQAADILVREFGRFAEIGRRPLAGADDVPALVSANLLDAPIEELDLPMRAYNSLKRNNITKIGQLLALGDDELLRMRNFGKKSLDEMKERLALRGFITTESAGSADESDLPAAAALDEAAAAELDREG